VSIAGLKIPSGSGHRGGGRREASDRYPVRASQSRHADAPAGGDSAGTMTINGPRELRVDGTSMPAAFPAGAGKLRFGIRSPDDPS
jgi:hypothetical protein